MNLRTYQMKSKQLLKMSMEQGLYAQVVMIRRRESDDKKEKEKTNKYNFQVQSARSRRCFDIVHEWLEVNFRTREPDFYKTVSNLI